MSQKEKPLNSASEALVVTDRTHFPIPSARRACVDTAAGALAPRTNAAGTFSGRI